MIYQSIILNLTRILKNEKLSFRIIEANTEFKLLCNFKNSFELIEVKNSFLKDLVYLVKVFKYFFQFIIHQRLTINMNLYLKIKAIFSNKFFISKKMVEKF